MAQQQRQQYGRQTDKYGNEIHQTEQYENPLNGGGGEPRTAGYGGEHGTTGGGYRGTQYGTTEFGGGTAGYGGGHGTTGGGFSGTQYGTTDIGGGKKGHDTAGGMQNKTSDVGGGGAVVGGYSTTGATGAHHGTGGEHFGSTGTGIGTGAGAALGLGGRPHYGGAHQGDYGKSGRHHGEHQDQYGSGIGTGADDLGLGQGHQEGEMMRGGHRGHDEKPAVTTTTTTIATGVSYEQEGQDEERKGMIDKVLDKVPGFH